MILGLFLLLVYGFFQHGGGWNENSRFALVRALVDDRTTRIDAYHERTGDKALFDGHYYSDKQPGSSFLAVPGYALLKAAALAGGNAEVDDARALGAATFFGAGLPTVALALLLRRYAASVRGEPRGTLAGLAFGLGSSALPFAALYFGHAAATCFLFVTFYMLARQPLTPRVVNPIAAGFLAGWAVLVDVAAALGVALVMVYGVARLGWRVPVYALAGAAAPLAVFAAYNWVSFRDPLALGYAHLESEYFASRMGQGVLGVTTPRFDALLTLLFDARGLVPLSPWVALAPVGAWAAWRRGLRLEAALAVGISVAYLLVNAGYYLPFGGFTPGPRFLLPTIPFLALLVAFVPRAWLPVAILTALYAGVLAFAALATIPRAPAEVVNPVTELWLPRLMTGDVADNGAHAVPFLEGGRSLLVLLLGAVLAVGAFVATTRPGRGTERLGWAGTIVLFGLGVSFATPLGPSALAVVRRVLPG